MTNMHTFPLNLFSLFRLKLFEMSSLKVRLEVHRIVLTKSLPVIASFTDNFYCFGPFFFYFVFTLLFAPITKPKLSSCPLFAKFIIDLFHSLFHSSILPLFHSSFLFLSKQYGFETTSLVIQCDVPQNHWSVTCSKGAFISLLSQHRL